MCIIILSKIIHLFYVICINNPVRYESLKIKRKEQLKKQCEPTLLL